MYTQSASDAGTKKIDRAFRRAYFLFGIATILSFIILISPTDNFQHHKFESPAAKTVLYSC